MTNVVFKGSNPLSKVEPGECQLCDGAELCKPIAISAIIVKVFPKPIASARIPPRKGGGGS